MDWTVWGLNPSGVRFPMPVQTGPGAHPPSYTMCTRLFLKIKWLECGVDHPPPSSTEAKQRKELHLYSQSVPSGQVMG
jgi:hypothetical protein